MVPLLGTTLLRANIVSVKMIAENMENLGASPPQGRMNYLQGVRAGVALDKAFAVKVLIGCCAAILQHETTTFRALPPLPVT